jgi:hypothetical protein
VLGKESERYHRLMILPDRGNSFDSWSGDGKNLNEVICNYIIAVGEAEE